MKKLVQDSLEFKELVELSEETLLSIDVKSIQLIQEVPGKGYKGKLLEPRLIIKVTNGKDITVDGYDRIIDMFRTLLRMAKEKNLKFYQRVISLIQSYLAGVIVVYAGNEKYIIKRKATGEYIELKIEEKMLENLFTAGVSDAMLTTQLMKAIHQEFFIKYGSSKRNFYFNGVYWSTEDENDQLKVMLPSEIAVMLNNTVAGKWGPTGSFEPRSDVRTWTSEISYEQKIKELEEEDASALGVTGNGEHTPDTKIIAGMQFRSISNEKWRKYEYSDGNSVHITKPLWLNVSKSGGHRVLDEKGVSHYVREGWRNIKWQVKDGCSPFAF